MKTLRAFLLVLLLMHGARRPFPAAFGAQVISDATAASPSLPVGCSPERPVVPLDGSVKVRAWAAEWRAQTLLHYFWSASFGTVSGDGREARWDLKGVSSGIYTADVKVEDGAATLGTCTLRVIVREGERSSGPERAAARTYLLKYGREAAGYGLYSYLLLGSHPTERTRERYQNIIQAYLNMIDDVNEFVRESRDRIGRLNVTYLPLETAAPEGADTGWVLQHYDYVRSRLLLDMLPGNRKSGIYLVSSLRPLSGGANPPYLLQDLTALPPEPPDLPSWWINEFLNQAAQERFWEPRTGELFVLKMRTTIAVLAGGLPEVQQAITQWISWVK